MSSTPLSLFPRLILISDMKLRQASCTFIFFYSAISFFLFFIFIFDMKLRQFSCSFILFYRVIFLVRYFHFPIPYEVESVDLLVCFQWIIELICHSQDSLISMRTFRVSLLTVRMTVFHTYVWCNDFFSYHPIDQERNRIYLSFCRILSYPHPLEIFFDFVKFSRFRSYDHVWMEFFCRTYFFLLSSI